MLLFIKLNGNKVHSCIYNIKQTGRSIYVFSVRAYFSESSNPNWDGTIAKSSKNAKLSLKGKASSL